MWLLTDVTFGNMWGYYTPSSLPHTQGVYTGLSLFLHIWHKQPLAWEDEKVWSIPAFAFDVYFQGQSAIELPKYDTSCNVHYTAPTILKGFYPYLIQILTKPRSFYM